MLPLKLSIEGILSKAISRAFPIKENCEVKFTQSSCDYVSDIPKIIFNKYKTGLHSFGLFNEREIADCIFVNCEKTDYIKAVQISGSGDLEIFINDNFITSTLNSILKLDQVTYSDSLNPKEMIFCHLLLKSSEIKTLSYVRTENLIKSLSKIIKCTGKHPKALNLLLTQDNLSKNIIQTNENLFQVPFINESSITYWLEDFASTIKEKQSILYFFKYFHSHFYSKSLSSISIPYGEIFSSFLSSDQTLYSANVEKLHEVLKSESLSSDNVLAYYMLKHEVRKTFLLSENDLNTKSSESLYSSLAVLEYARRNVGAGEEIGEITNENRDVYMHAMLIPEVLDLCIKNCSVHHLVDWIERYSSLYVRCSASFTGDSLKSLNKLTCILLSHTLYLIFPN